MVVMGVLVSVGVHDMMSLLVGLVHLVVVNVLVAVEVLRAVAVLIVVSEFIVLCILSAVSVVIVAVDILLAVGAVIVEVSSWRQFAFTCGGLSARSSRCTHAGGYTRSPKFWVTVRFKVRVRVSESDTYGQV